MGRLLLLLGLALGAMGGCAEGTGRNKQGLYVIQDRDQAVVQYRMLDSVNLLRQTSGAGPLRLDPRLTAAAQGHAADIEKQQRAWAFGSDGSNPYQRVVRSGYSGALAAEMYLAGNKSEIEVLDSWTQNPAWGTALLDPDATDMGFAWVQDSRGIIWWVLTLGQDRAPADIGQPAF